MINVKIQKVPDLVNSQSKWAFLVKKRKGVLSYSIFSLLRILHIPEPMVTISWFLVTGF